MLDLALSYEAAFESQIRLDVASPITVSEVQGHNVSKRARAHFYTYLRDHLKNETAESAYALGLFYRYRKLCGEWFKKTVDYWEFATAKGDWRSAWFLYELFNYGEFEQVEKDPVAALKWLERCYELSPVAEVGNMIARRYVCGEGTERNPEKAKEYYIKGMLQNDDHAIRELQVLMKALRELKADTESQRIERYCMRELAIRCGAKVLK